MCSAPNARNLPCIWRVICGLSLQTRGNYLTFGALSIARRAKLDKFKNMIYSVWFVRESRMRLGQHATLAQSVERLPRNEKVDSSILSSGSLTHSSVLILLICFYSLDCLYESMREWRNGRRAGFRFLCLTTCGFKSHLAHEIFRLFSNK